MKRWFLCILALCAGLTVRAQRLEELLPQLDEALAQADKYVAEKEVRIKTLENPVHSRGVSA